MTRQTQFVPECCEEKVGNAQLQLFVPSLVFQLQSICSSLLRQRIQGFPVVKSILSLKQLRASKDLNLFKLSGMPKTP